MYRIMLMFATGWQYAGVLARAALATPLIILRLLGMGSMARRMAENIVVKWGAWSIRTLDCKVEIQGQEHVPMEGPLVVMANHQSMFDIPLVIHAVGRSAGYVAKNSLFRVPGIAFWLRTTHSISMNRSDNLSGGRALQAHSQFLRDKNACLIIFPEGTRTRDENGVIQPFRRGSVRLAEPSNLPILPVAIDGTRHLGNYGPMKATRKGGRLIRVKIGPVRHVQTMNAPERKAFMDSLEAEIRQYWEEIKLDWPAPTTDDNANKPND